MTECAPIPDSYEKDAEHIRFEHCVRLFLFRQLAAQHGVNPPVFEELIVSPIEIPGLVYDVPALRLSWQDAIFFEFDKDDPGPDALPALDMIAEAIRLDIGDVHLYVVGHTDAVGSPGYNRDLSMRRARGVLERLRDAGIPVDLMTYTGMGARQPVASNLTDEGRAHNRRVEFLLSAEREVNHVLVRNREVDERWLTVVESGGALRQIARETSYEVWSLGESESFAIFKLPPPITQHRFYELPAPAEHRLYELPVPAEQRIYELSAPAKQRI